MDTDTDRAREDEDGHDSRYQEAIMSALHPPSVKPVEPTPEQESADQASFDAVVERDSRVALSVLAAVGILAALAMSAVALVRSGGSSTAKVATVTHTVTVTSGAATATAPVVSLKVVPGGKRGPDGIMHDYFTVTNFHVKVGQPTTLRIDNTDEGTHSITAPLAGVDIVVQPGVHDYTLLVSKAGHFEWACIIPCDDEAHGWAMKHPGYMAGYITAS
jgi:uncharacterized cupredoxin-like copper-binding protein